MSRLIHSNRVKILCVGFIVIVYVHGIPDLIAKVDYYLSHDDERLRIACNGYEKVKSECTFEKRMNKILSGML